MNVLVVGGNGFIGSAVCKAALARGMQVTSISSSGVPFKTPNGHMPAWTSKVNWKKADAVNPETYDNFLKNSTAVVHTLGVLLESQGGSGSYKDAVRSGNPLALATSIFQNAFGGGNPLLKGDGEYEKINRDLALTVCEAFKASTSSSSSASPSSRKPFVYISAEDIFRPVIPARYIESKRAAERGIARLLQDRPDLRPVFVRPSLVYHAHIRPLTTPLAALFNLSAHLHRSAAPSFPTPASLLRSLASDSNLNSSLGTSTSTSIANALTIPPIHVEHVAKAVVSAIEDSSVEGVLDVRRMRAMMGFAGEGEEEDSVRSGIDATNNGTNGHSDSDTDARPGSGSEEMLRRL